MPDEPSTESLFAEWLDAHERRLGPSFDDFAERHPSHRSELRALYAEWKQLQVCVEPESHIGALASTQNLVSTEVAAVADMMSRSRGWQAYLDTLRSRGEGYRRYEMRGEIGRGGMGAVLRVYDRDARRELAMKVILRERERRSETEDDAAVSRFLEEAQITAQLDHPGIVPIHEIGLDGEGRIYFTMKLVKGRDLKAVLAECGGDRASLTSVLHVLLRACDALSYAHSRGVVHRDIKPTNIMVGRYGEAYVMDWGIARVLGEPDRRDLRPRQPDPTTIVASDRHRAESPGDYPLVTMDGQVIGTPSYMSYEQARGAQEDIGPHTDVYGMGAILYELLTGLPPYVTPAGALSPRAIWARVLEAPPRSIHELKHGAPAELSAICEKAMSREISRRYPTMIELADDLRSYLEGRVVKAHAVGAWVELRKWLARNRVVAAIAMAGTLVIGSLSVWHVRRLAASVKSEQAERRAAVAAGERAERSAHNARLLAASGLVDLGEYFAASRLLDSSPPERRGWVWEHLTARASPFLAEYSVKDRAATETVIGLARDSKRAMVRSQSGVALFDALSGASVGTVTTGKPIAMAFSARGSHAAVLDASGLLELRETDRWSVLDSVQVDLSDLIGEPVIRISDGAERVAVSLERELSFDPVERLREVQGWLLTWRPGEPPQSVKTYDSPIALDPSGDIVYAADFERLLRINPDRLEVVGWFDVGDYITSVACAGNRRVLVGLADGTIEVFREDGANKTSLRGHLRDVDSIAVVPGAQFAWTASSSDERLCRWDLEQGRLITTLPGVLGGSVAVTPNQDLVACSRFGYAASLPAFFESGRVTLGDHEYVHQMAFVPGGQRLVSISPIEVRVWDCARATALISATIPSGVGDIEHLAISGSGDWIAAIGRTWSTKIDRFLWIWDLQTLEVVHHQELDAAWGWTTVHSLGERLLLSQARCEGDRWLPGGSRLVAWDRQSATLATVLEPPTAWLSIDTWSERELIVAEHDGRVRRWRADTFEVSVDMGPVEVVNQAEDDIRPVVKIALSPDRHHLWVHRKHNLPAHSVDASDDGTCWLAATPWYDIGLSGRSLWGGDDLLVISDSEAVRFCDATSAETRLLLPHRGSQAPAIAFDASTGQFAIVDEGHRIVVLHAQAQRLREVQLASHVARLAEGLVATLAKESLSREVLEQRIASSTEVSEDVRGHAQRLARYAELATPESLFDQDDALQLIGGAPPLVAREMIRHLELVREFEPDNRGVSYMGVAYYRAGEFERALRSIRDALGRSAQPEEQAILRAFEALALARLGAHADAVETAERALAEMRATIESVSSSIQVAASANPLVALRQELETLVSASR